MKTKRFLALALAALMALWTLAEVPAARPALAEKADNGGEYAVTEGLPEDWINILILGSDKRKGKRYGDTDAIMVLSVNREAGQAKLTSILRDIAVKPEDTGKRCKLKALCRLGGPTLTMRTLNRYFGLNMENYVLVNLPGLAGIIDLMGGLELDVSQMELAQLNLELLDVSPFSGPEKLEDWGRDTHVNGNQAVAFARMRKQDSDADRAGRQRYVLTRIAAKLQTVSPAALPGLVAQLLEGVETNMKLPLLLELARAGMTMDLERVRQLQLPAEHTYKASSLEGAWCLEADFKANRQRLYDFIYR